MSIPLDQLYHYIEGIAKEVDKNILIYRFWPHGSKKLENLEPIEGDIEWINFVSKIPIHCHDQEPLEYGLKNLSSNESVYCKDIFSTTLKSLSLLDPTKHNLSKGESIYNKTCLLHSEKRSKHVIDYQNNRCIPVYYWSHAVIAQDWFRYARHVTQQKKVNRTFLIYNRAWSGTREYRLRFSELLINLGLQDLCQTSVNPNEPQLGIHYEMHQFKNPIWRPQTVLENFFPTSNAHSHYSANFDIEDYEATDIEVVLETLFDDDRLHLTEKSLRPIACGQPFILAGTQGSLEYLRSYGFKTFGNIWDETYDTLEDPAERLIQIVELMNQIKHWLPYVRERKMAEAQAIAEYNRQHFFSQQFFDLVITELKNNLKDGINQLKTEADFTAFANCWKHRLSFDQIQQVLKTESLTKNSGLPTIDQINDLLKQLSN